MLQAHEFLPRERRLGSRVHTGMWLAVLIAASWTGCAPADECTTGDFRCSGAELQRCFADHAGVPVGSVHYSHGGPNSWLHIADCGSANLCKVLTPADGGSAPKGSAFCVIDPAPEPVCAAGPADGTTATVCVGTTGVDCEGGFAVARRACAICSAGNCEGKIDSPCESGSDCASGLVCGANGYCVEPCSCPEGARCDACALVDQEAPAYGGPSAPVQWVCHAGSCLQR